MNELKENTLGPWGMYISCVHTCHVDVDTHTRHVTGLRVPASTYMYTCVPGSS